MRWAMVHGTATASYCVEALGTLGIETLSRSAVSDRVQRIRRLFHLED